MIQRVTFCWISQFIGVAKSLFTDPDVYQASYCYIIWEIFRSNSSLSSVCGLGTRISPLVTHCICKWMSSFYPPKYIYILYIYLRAVSTIKIHQDTVHPSFALFSKQTFRDPWNTDLLIGECNHLMFGLTTLVTFLWIPRRLPGWFDPEVGRPLKIQ